MPRFGSKRISFLLGGLCLLIAIFLITSQKDRRTTNQPVVVNKQEEPTIVVSAPIKEQESNTLTKTEDSVVTEHVNSQAFFEEDRKKYAASEVARYQTLNKEYQTTLFKQFVGLPQPVETPATIQTYQPYITSSSGNGIMYRFVTYKKSSEFLNDFSGELGVVNADLYLCNKLTERCERSDVVKNLSVDYNHFPSNPTWWDMEKERFYFTNCGEGGDCSLIAMHDVKNNKDFSIGGFGSALTRINATLTFAVVLRADTNNLPTRLEIYSTDDFSKPTKVIDVQSWVSQMTRSSSMPTIDLQWSSEGTKALFTIEGQTHTIDLLEETVK